jgi:hypothetical protein
MRSIQNCGVLCSHNEMIFQQRRKILSFKLVSSNSVHLSLTFSQQYLVCRLMVENRKRQLDDSGVMVLNY